MIKPLLQCLETTVTVQLRLFSEKIKYVGRNRVTLLFTKLYNFMKFISDSLHLNATCFYTKVRLQCSFQHYSL